MKQLSVIDLFCGGGGFSEGFRQQGFSILGGYDNWLSAVGTYSYNFKGKGVRKNILDFESSIADIEAIPDSDVIIGSPPCVSFSTSNRSGKADKSMGLRLTEAFLRVVAIKKFKKDSILQVWLMENVSNSIKYFKPKYSFNDLNLNQWALKNGYKPSMIAIVIEGNHTIVNSADYGSPQIRKRAITGEFIKAGKLLIPKPKYSARKGIVALPPYKDLGTVMKALPSPFHFKQGKKVLDPNYEIEILQENLSDHFYDTGLYECQWKFSQFHKTNHPFMGKMSFPENLSKPSRTICATNIGTSRESIVYRSEIERAGDGEYRTPTAREAATIMGFPITYQFVGTESVKLRQIGNAVSPCVSRAFAEEIRVCLGSKIVPIKINAAENTKVPNDLNTFSRKIFGTPPKKREGSRFRRHPFKDGNITVTLSNYDIICNDSNFREWRTSIQYGNGDGFPTFNIPNGFYKKVEDIISQQSQGTAFLNAINNGFTKKIANAKKLQAMYEQQRSEQPFDEPTLLVEKVAQMIESLQIEDVGFRQNGNEIFKNKRSVPLKQLFALYAINKISTLANG